MSEENVEVMRKLYSHWEHGDFSPRTDVFDAEVQWVRAGGDLEAGGLAGEWRGPETEDAFRDWLRAWDNLRIEGEDFRDLGDRVLVLDRHVGMGKRSGIPLDHQMGQVVTLRNGKIVRWEAYWTREQALEAAGLSE